MASFTVLLAVRVSTTNLCPTMSTHFFHSQNKLTEVYATLPSGMSVLEAEINCENVLLN